MDYGARHRNVVSLWERIFRETCLDKYCTLIDLCPGQDPKIEEALGEYGFSGIVFAADTSCQALEKLKSEAHPNGYTLFALVGDIGNMVFPPHRAMAGNHLTDDLMSYIFCADNGIDYYRMPVDVSLSRAVWDAINRNPGKPEEYAIETLRNASSALPSGGLLVISQYPSKFEIQHGFGHETAVCDRVFRRMVGSLSSRDFFEERAAVEKAFADSGVREFRSEHWAALRKK